MNRTLAYVWSVAVFLLLPLAGVASAQERAQPKGWVAAQIQFEKNCSKCHGNANFQAKTPTREALMKLSPEAIYASLTSGSMSVQAKDLADDQKRLIAQHFGGRPFGVAAAGDARTMSNRCSTNPPMGDPSAGTVWNGWSNDAVNTRFQSAQAAGLSAAQVPNLKLKWAFGIPLATEMYSQPTIVGGMLYVGSGYIGVGNGLPGNALSAFSAE